MGTWKTDVSPTSPTSENISSSTPGGIRGKGKLSKGLGGKEPEINLRCHQIYLWCISTYFGSRTGKDTSGTTALVRGRLTLAREGSLGGRPVSTPI